MDFLETGQPKYCPKCKTEYRQGFKECANCKVSLVAKLPEEKAKLNEDIPFEEILTIYTDADIVFIKSLLESMKINFYFSGKIYYTGEKLPGAAKLFVKKDEADTARELLKDFKHGRPSHFRKDKDD